MGKYTVDLSAAAEARLQLLAEGSNAATGRADDLAGYISYHLREFALRQELAEQAQSLREQAHATGEAAVWAAKERAIETL